jgi:hypothetical protein
MSRTLTVLSVAALMAAMLVTSACQRSPQRVETAAEQPSQSPIVLLLVTWLRDTGL